MVAHLQRTGAEFQAPARDATLSGGDLGHVVYCIGLTANFRERPHDTIEAHVCKLLDVIRGCTFESLLYLSSTRVYLHGSGREDDDLRVNPLHADDLYNLSKLTGEAIALSLGPRGRVARVSNAYGPRQSASFLTMIRDEAARHGTITLRTALESVRDYVSVDDVAPLLVQIALHGRERIYNVASGVNVSHGELAAIFPECRVSVVPDAPAVHFPPIDIGRIRNEFGFAPRRLQDELRSI